MAYTFVTMLQPYVGLGNNIIKSKIDLENNSIKLADERIERQTEHLKKYEEKLRSKFTAMEKAMQGSKAQKGWMNAQMGGGDEGK
jgi:flagellar capping protein FliD